MMPETLRMDLPTRARGDGSRESHGLGRLTCAVIAGLETHVHGDLLRTWLDALATGEVARQSTNVGLEITAPLITSACAQMGHSYDLTVGSAAGMCDAKLPDMQAGWEQGITNSLAGLAGLNMCYEAVGMHASLLGFCM